MTTSYPCSFEVASQKPLEDILKPLTPGSWCRKVKTLSDAIHGKVKLVEGFLPDQPKTFVIKQIPKATLESANGIECPRNEIYASLAISHDFHVPSAAKAYFAGKDEKFYYLASEHCPNGELLEVINRNGHLKTDSLLREVVSQILTGVADLHQAGVAHRDLSLENVLIAADGGLRLIDFAQAVMVHAPGDLPAAEARVSQEHGPPGKKHFRGPELANGESYLATKVDTFAIGVMIYALATGSYPFVPGETSFEGVPRVDLFPAGEAASGRCGRLRLQLQMANEDIANNISPGCLDLMEKLLAPNPELRLSAKEALNHNWITNVDNDDDMEYASTDCTGDMDMISDYSDTPSFGFADHAD